MNRGDLVTVALSGDDGKPRPALVIQSDYFDQHPSVTLLPVTSELRDTPLFRVALDPDDTTHLQHVSQVMVDMAVTVRRDRIGRVFGHVDPGTMLEVDRCLAIFLGIAK